MTEHKDESQLPTRLRQKASAWQAVSGPDATEGQGGITTNSQPVNIGGNAEKPGREWNGLIDDVRIYSYALSPAEVAAIYAGKGPTDGK